MRFPSAQPSTLPLLVLLQQHAAATISNPSTYLLLSGSTPLPGQPESQKPNPNLLAYLSTNPESSAPISSSSLCTSFLSRDGTALHLPDARIPLSSAGFIDCFLEQPQGSQKQGLNQDHQNKKQLVFTGIPAGWQFSIMETFIAGWLELDKGSVVERVEIGVWYPEPSHHQYGAGEGSGGNTNGVTDRAQVSGDDWNGVLDGHNEAGSETDKGGKWDLKRYLPLSLPLSLPTQETRSQPPTPQPCKSRSQKRGPTDKATSFTPYGRFGFGYQGSFNLSMSVKPDGGSRSKQELAVSPCSMGPDMKIAVSVELWFSLSMEQIEVGEAVVHRGMLGGDGEPGSERESGEKMLRLGLRGEWNRC